MLLMKYTGVTKKNQTKRRKKRNPSGAEKPDHLEERTKTIIPKA